MKLTFDRITTMTCVHLRRLFQLCEDNDLKFSGRELVHVVCKQCQLEEVCPSLLVDEYESAHADDADVKEPGTTEASDLPESS